MPMASENCMSLQQDLAAKALAARKAKAAEDKAIADERYSGRQQQASAKVQAIFESLHKTAASGLTETQVVISDCCMRKTGVGGTETMDDPIVDYLGSRCKEEGLTVTQQQGDSQNQYRALISWGSGE